MTVSNLRGKKSFLGEVGKMDEIFNIEIWVDPAAAQGKLEEFILYKTLLFMALP